MKAQVKALVAAPAETKYVSEALYQMNGATIPGAWIGFSSAITGVGEIYAGMPHISQGTDDHNRIGNQINPKRLRIKLDIACKYFPDTSARDRTVHVFVLTAKSVKSLDNYTSIPITQLLDRGNGTKTTFDGTQFHAQFPVNTSEFTVLKHKAMRMVQGFGLANSVPGVDAGSTDGVISPAHSYARIALNVKTPAKFKYDRASQTFPTNYAPFLVIGFTHNNSNGVAPSDFVQVLGQTQLYYTDD